jgi:hypothetical protein
VGLAFFVGAFLSCASQAVTMGFGARVRPAAALSLSPLLPLGDASGNLATVTPCWPQQAVSLSSNEVSDCTPKLFGLKKVVSDSESLTVITLI